MSDPRYSHRLIEGSIASLITIFIFDRGRVRYVRRQLRRLPPVGFANHRATATQDWEPIFRRVLGDVSREIDRKLLNWRI
jgi:hypothetical protein